jgi:hypothetical protein
MERRRFKQTPLNSFLPKKRSVYAKKPDRFHLALYRNRVCVEPAKPEPARI